MGFRSAVREYGTIATIVAVGAAIAYEQVSSKKPNRPSFYIQSTVYTPKPYEKAVQDWFRSFKPTVDTLEQRVDSTGASSAPQSR